MSERDKLIAQAEALDWAASECEHWQTISTTPGHKCGECLAAVLRSRAKELRALAAQQPEAVEPVAYMIWAPFTGPAQFTTDKTAPIKTAQRADYTCTPLYAHASDFKDAYVGAREDLEVWKRRALAAEENNRQLLRALSEEVNSPMYDAADAVAAGKSEGKV